MGVCCLGTSCRLPQRQLACADGAGPVSDGFAHMHRNEVRMPGTYLNPTALKKV